MRARLPFSWPTRVYWEDTDAGGVVYHGSYIRFLERARSEWLRALGLGQAELQQQFDRIFAIRAMQLDFRQPARLDDALDVRVDAVEIGRASLEFVQSIRCADAAGERCLVEAKVKAACLVGSSFKPVAIAADLRQRLLDAC